MFVFSPPQNYSYPSRNHSFAEGGLPPNYYDEKVNRLVTLRDLVNEYNLVKEANRSLHLTRDIDDDEIYV